MDRQDFEFLRRQFAAQWFHSADNQRFDLAVIFLEHAYALGVGVAGGPLRDGSAAEQERPPDDPDSA
jgi:hypothetical protein